MHCWNLKIVMKIILKHGQTHKEKYLYYRHVGCYGVGQISANHRLSLNSNMFSSCLYHFVGYDLNKMLRCSDLPFFPSLRRDEYEDWWHRKCLEPMWVSFKTSINTKYTDLYCFSRISICQNVIWHLFPESFLNKRKLKFNFLSLFQLYRSKTVEKKDLCSGWCLL